MSALTLRQAEALAERTLAALEPDVLAFYGRTNGQREAADRERVQADLEGLKAVWSLYGDLSLMPKTDRDHFRRYYVGLIRTARLYGVEL